MKLKNTTLVLVFGLLSFSLNSCDYFNTSYDKGSVSIFNILDNLSNQSDAEGNLLITNQNRKRFYLYVDDSIVKLIPAHVEDFKVLVHSKIGEATDLSLYLVDELNEDELANPPKTKVFIQWKAFLSTDNFSSNAIKWNIPDNPHEVIKANVLFKYPKITFSGDSIKDNVDVYLNSTSGAKLFSIKPGQSIPKSLEYGYQVLLFRYWRSSTITGEEEIGWVQEKPNGSNYGLVLNYNYDSVAFDIPVYFEQYVNSFGNIKISNNLDRSLILKANNQLFENFIVLPDGESTQGMSYIGAKQTNNYKIPVGYYIIVAMIPETNEIVDKLEIDIGNDVSVWVVGD